MSSLKDILPSTETIVYAYASIFAMVIAFRTVLYLYEMIPENIRVWGISKISHFYETFIFSSSFTFVIEQSWDTRKNEMYHAAEVFLLNKIDWCTGSLLIGSNDTRSMTSPPKLAIPGGSRFIHDFMIDMRLEWTLHFKQTRKNLYDRKYFSLTCRKKDKDEILKFYFPHVITTARGLIFSKQQNLYISTYNGEAGVWESNSFKHPSTFKTLAMEEKLKESIIQDLWLFVYGEAFFDMYCRVWKRGYLIYGPSGCGKTALVAAIANHLDYNIYTIQFSTVRNDAELRRMLASTTNRSILLFENVEYCRAMLSRDHRRGSGAAEGDNGRANKMLQESGATLSGLLNFIDGLWSTCAQERIIIFTTSHKDKLDPALLRPGRMDFHIEMTYCTPELFKMLAYRRLGITQHDYFRHIEDVIRKIKVTPAEVAHQLDKYHRAGCVIEHLCQFLFEKEEIEYRGN